MRFKIYSSSMLQAISFYAIVLFKTIRLHLMSMYIKIILHWQGTEILSPIAEEFVINDIATIQSVPLKICRLARRNQASGPVLVGTFCAFSYGLWGKRVWTSVLWNFYRKFIVRLISKLLTVVRNFMLFEPQFPLPHEILKQTLYLWIMALTVTT